MINQYPIATVTTIDYAHNKTHEGRYFSGGFYNSALADTATLDILIQNGSVSTFHMVCSAAVSGNSTIQIYEGTTFSSAGSAVAMSNHNRSSANVFSGTVTSTPTITLVGTQLNGTAFAPGGGKHSGSGAAAGFSNEFILAKSTSYLVRVTNISGGTIKASLEIEGYQPTL